MEGGREGRTEGGRREGDRRDHKVRISRFTSLIPEFKPGQRGKGVEGTGVGGRGNTS